MPDAGTATAPVALVFDYASAWAWETQPQGRDFDYFRLVFDFYKGLRRLGPERRHHRPRYRRSSANTNWSWPPVWPRCPTHCLDALQAYKGHALLGPRTNAKTAEFATPVPLAAQPSRP